MRKAMYLMGVLDDTDIEWLATHGAGRRLASGQVLVREGQPIDSLFVVLDGSLAVTAGPTRVATLYAGEVVGEISFVDARPPLATVAALDDAHVLAIPRALLQRKLDTDKKFAANFYRSLAVFLADRLRATTHLLGYGAPDQDREPAGDPDELGDDLLETASMGARRFDDFLRRIARE